MGDIKMSYVSIVANNGMGVVDSWERVAVATEKNQLINVEAKEFEECEQAAEHTYEKFITRFYTRNRWRVVNIPLPAELPCKQIYLDNEYEEREAINMINVTPKEGDMPLLDCALREKG